LGSTEVNPVYTYTTSGIYKAILKVKDDAGGLAADTVEIRVAGNSPPQITIVSPENKTFYWDFEEFKYSVSITDREDVTIEPDRMLIYLDYNKEPFKKAKIPVVNNTVETNFTGKRLLEQSDCRSCHAITQGSMAPAFALVAKRYKDNAEGAERLAKKIITGGTGYWGPFNMPQHPQFTIQQTTEIVKYILSLTDPQKQKTNLPMEGTAYLYLNDRDDAGYYTVLAAYTDKGGDARGPLINSKTLLLRNSKVEAEDADMLEGIIKNEHDISLVNQNAWFVLKNIDLTGIKQLTYRYAANTDSFIEVHTGSLTGPLVSTSSNKATGGRNMYAELSAPMTNTIGFNDLYFVFVKGTLSDTDLIHLDWIKFNK